MTGQNNHDDFLERAISAYEFRQANTGRGFGGVIVLPGPTALHEEDWCRKKTGKPEERQRRVLRKGVCLGGEFSSNQRLGRDVFAATLKSPV